MVRVHSCSCRLESIENDSWKKSTEKKKERREKKKGKKCAIHGGRLLRRAMAGVTAADHERISKFCLVRLWGWGSRSRSTNREPLGTSPAGLDSSQSLGAIHFICLLMGVMRHERARYTWGV